MYDIFYIGTQTDEFFKLKRKYPLIKCASTIFEAKKKSLTKLCWIVWNDLIVDSNFKFSYKVPSWDESYVHLFKNGEHYDGICLVSKDLNISEREVAYRFFLNKKEVDELASVPRSYDSFVVDTYEEYLHALENSNTEMFWATSRNIKIDDSFKFDMYFTHDNEYDRHENHAFIHRVEDTALYNGVFLFSKHKLVSEKEINHRFIIDRKDWDIVASGPTQYEIFKIDSYSEYLHALENSNTEMFWATSRNIKIDDGFKFDIYFTHDNEYDRHENHAFVHRVNDENLYNGVFLFSKRKPVSEKEIDHRFIIGRKDWPVVASGPVVYDKFTVDTYEEYSYALENSNTEMFWATSRNIKIDDNFKFDIYFANEYDRHENHAFIHRVNDENLYNGLFLFSKHKPVSEKEINHRFIVDRKDWDIVASGPVQYEIHEIDSYSEYLHALEHSITEMFWATSRNIKIDDSFKFDMYFTHDNEYDRHENHAFVHRVNDENLYNGVFLFSKHKPVSEKEINHRFIIDRKDWDIVASGPTQYEIFKIDSYSEYLHALENSNTEMFWATSRNIKIDDTFKFDMYFANEYDRHENHAFVHRVNDENLYNGVFLFSKHKLISEKEINHRFIIDRKDWPVVASGPVVYDKFTIDTYEDYLYAASTSTTEMFWIVPKEVKIINNFDFDLYFPHNDEFNRNINHSFKHVFRDELNFNGIHLVAKSKMLSSREITYRSILETKHYDTIASKLRPYDVVFISYNEPTADENYFRLLETFPTAKRVHGVKGIHNAHIKAASISETEMFWVVDGDANIVDDFKFDYQVPVWDQEVVHVWKSKNPVNNLIYGYGGVKLLPRKLTLALDTSSADMTTSISKEFKVMDNVSNITAFNTDPFNTWKSAFRECVKLASKIIDRQVDEETANRLHIWRTVANGAYADYAIKGALDAEKFVADARNISLINDFDELKKMFDQ